MANSARSLIRGSLTRISIATSLSLALVALLCAPFRAEASENFSGIIQQITVSDSTITISYLQPLGCAVGKPELILIDKNNVQINSGNIPLNKGDEVRVFISIPTDASCKTPTPSTPQIISAPNQFGLTNIKPFLVANPGNSEPSSQPATQLSKTSTEAIRFLAITQNDQSKGESDRFQLEELNYQPGQPVIRTVLGNRGINTILGTTKDGAIVKTFEEKPKTGTGIKLWLVTTKSWKLLSTKIIYIEPGVLSADQKWLIGRQVADGPSTKIFSQNLATGKIDVLFNANSLGGYVCGAYADKENRFAYFSHVGTKRTYVYQIDLKTRMMKKQGPTIQGFCLSGTTDDNRLTGLVRNQKGEALYAIVAETKIPDNFSSHNIQFPVRDALVLNTAGEDSSHFFLFNSLYVIQDLMKQAIYISKWHVPNWDGPIDTGGFIQFINPLPASWLTSDARPTQP